MSPRRKLGTGLGVALAALTLAGGATPAAHAQSTAACTQDIQFDPSVRTWDQVFPNRPIAGTNATGTGQRNLTNELYTYAQAVMADVANSSRVRIVERDIGATVLGRRLKYYILGTPENIANLDAGRNDGLFWRSVITGEVSAAEALTQVRERPAFAWITATPHGNEPAAGEAISRQLYELAARTDCHNVERLDNLTLFLDPARNPDGRDVHQPPHGLGLSTRTATSVSATSPRTGSSCRRSTSTRACSSSTPTRTRATTSSRPTRIPVHHELSDFSLDFIQNVIGPAIQQKFNDQSINYRNYFRTTSSRRSTATPCRPC